jgi:hypothetical protein
VQLALWLGNLFGQVPRDDVPVPRAVEPGTRNPEQLESHLVSRLQSLGLPPFREIQTHRNRQVMLSFAQGGQFRLHAGYAHAPDAVLQAIVRFVSPGVRRATRLKAREIFLAFPADEHAPAPARPRRPARPRPGDAHLLAQLQLAFEELNREHFGGTLGAIPILISGRMRTRLGELRMERKSGRAVHIALSRRHLRRDGWVAVRETLLHEMVHQWQAETGRPVDHGPEFRRKSREVGITPRAVRRDLV